MSTIIQDIYQMSGEASQGQAIDMFSMMDLDGDGKITEQEFIQASLQDPDLVRMLSTVAWEKMQYYSEYQKGK